MSLTNTDSKSLPTTRIQWNKTRVNKDQCTYRWTITNFSKLNSYKTGKSVKSSIFSMDRNTDVEWILKLFPCGEYEESHDFIALYLFSNKMISDDIEVDCTVCILGANDEVCFKDDFKHNFVRNDLEEYGWSNFKQRKQLIDENLIMNDSLRIVCHVEAGFCFSNIKGEVNNDYKIEKPVSLSFESLLDKDIFSDFMILTKERRIYVHKNLLAAASPVFMGMFTHNMKENVTNFVDILDISPELVFEMLRFIYTSKVENLDIIAKDLLSVADRYQIEALKNMCQQSLCANLNDENVCDMLLLADLHNAIELKKKAMQFIEENSNEEIIASEGYERLAEYNSKLSVKISRIKVIYKKVTDANIPNNYIVFLQRKEKLSDAKS